MMALGTISQLRHCQINQSVQLVNTLIILIIVIIRALIFNSLMDLLVRLN